MVYRNNAVKSLGEMRCYLRSIPDVTSHEVKGEKKWGLMTMGIFSISQQTPYLAHTHTHL